MSNKSAKNTNTSSIISFLQWLISFFSPTAWAKWWAGDKSDVASPLTTTTDPVGITVVKNSDDRPSEFLPPAPVNPAVVDEKEKRATDFNTKTIISGSLAGLAISAFVGYVAYLFLRERDNSFNVDPSNNTFTNQSFFNASVAEVLTPLYDEFDPNNFNEPINTSTVNPENYFIQIVMALMTPALILLSKRDHINNVYFK